MRNSALLLSGGLDSIAVAYWQRPRIAITIDYGQLPAEAEKRAAQAVAEALEIEHHSFSLNLGTLGSGDMAGVPPSADAPVSEWWPFRNQFLLTIGGMLAVKYGLESVMVGSVATDAKHIDGSLAFLEIIHSLMTMQEGSINIEAPAHRYTSVELIQVSGVPFDLLSYAHSCHKSNWACAQRSPRIKALRRRSGTFAAGG
jgi:7-cyano-7-deazaguanine synthase